MEEFIIFEQFIGRNEPIFVRLASVADTQTFQYRVNGIKIKEGLGMGTPTVMVNFTDASGDLVNHNRLKGDAVYKLYMGKTLEESDVLRLKVAHIRHENGIGGKSEQFTFEVTFVHETWIDMMGASYNRGWGNARIGDVVRNIVSDVGFSKVNVSSTSRVMESIVQPYWTNLTMLRWLAKRADHAGTEQGHFEFGVNKSGDFFFQSIPDLVRSAKASPEPIPLMKLGGVPLSHAEKKRLEEQNGYVPINFLKFGSTERTMEMAQQGAGGVQGMNYDYNSGQFYKNDYTFGSSDIAQLSEWSLLNPGDEQAGLTINQGRDANVSTMSHNRISSSVMSTQMIRLECSGSIRLKIGGLVELLIPTPVDKSHLPYNEMYSGFYLISEVEHHIITRGPNANYQSVITVSRHGVDGKDNTGLVKSRRGRMSFNDSQ